MFPKTICPKCGREYTAASKTYAEDPKRRCGPCITAWAEKKPCPECGGGPIKTTKKVNWFQYGTGPGASQLKCIESLRTCQACSFEYLDWENEEIHMMAVNRYLIATGQQPQEKR